MMVRHKKLIRELLSKKQMKEKQKIMSVFEIFLSRYIDESKIDQIEAILKHMQIVHIGNTKCGNIRCNKDYLRDKYGLQITTDFGNDVSICMIINEIMKWNEKRVINKWYICAGCKTVKYCSRKCQKISWNKQYHGNICKKIQQNYKYYF